jgi:hypothetical protein
MPDDDVNVPPKLSENLAEIARLRRESAELIERLKAIRKRMTELSVEASKPEHGGDGPKWAPTL